MNTKAPDMRTVAADDFQTKEKRRRLVGIKTYGVTGKDLGRGVIKANANKRRDEGIIGM